jgi:hypothetical protein
MDTNNLFDEKIFVECLAIGILTAIVVAFITSTFDFFILRILLTVISALIIPNIIRILSLTRDIMKKKIIIFFPSHIKYQKHNLSAAICSIFGALAPSMVDAVMISLIQIALIEIISICIKKVCGTRWGIY